MSTRPDNPRGIPLYPSDSPAPEGMARRTMLQALLGGMGAAIAIPSIAEAQHPMVHHLESAALIGQARSNAAAADYDAVFLDGHQLRTLEALSESIVPGSTGAKVAPFLDQLLAVDSAENQR